MLKVNRIRKAIGIVSGVLAIVFVSAQTSFAQGCALCYSDASATSPQAQAALRHGILILLIPPMFIFSALFGMLYQRRNAHHEALHPVPGSSSMDASSEYVLHLD